MVVVKMRMEIIEGFKEEKKEMLKQEVKLSKV